MNHELRQMLVERSVRRGDFRLTSGLQSDVYIDGKLTTCTAAGTRLVGRAFLGLIRKHGWQPEAVGGMSIGADPIVIAIARESLEDGPTVDAFLVRKEPKKHGMQRFIEGLEVRTGMPVVIVDDVCSTGGSTADAIERARDAGMQVLGALALVDREMGAAERMRSLGCDFDSVLKLRDLV
jgi:orotate phosphoribosyltransferase